MPGLPSDEAGFSLVEVLAALALLGVITLGVIPLFIMGLRSSLTAKFETQAKNISQERFELMRNLPYYVTSSLSGPPASCYNNPDRTDPRAAGGAVECDYKDLLDTYYRSAVTAAPNSSSGGFVATNAGRSADETDAGLNAPFYRFLISPVPQFQNGVFSQVVVSQFLKADRTLATVPSTYNSQNSNFDTPPSKFLGVTLINRWTVGSTVKKYVVFTQIADTASTATTVTLQAQATALRIRSSVDGGTTELQTEVGISRSDGSIAGASSGSTYAQGIYASLVPGTRVDGAYTTASAPPSTTSSGGTGGSLALNVATPSSYTAVTAAASSTTNVTAAIVSDQPSVPATSPGGNFSTGSLLKSAASQDFTYTNGASLALLNGLVGLSSSTLVSSKVSGSGSAGTGQTYLTSTAGTGHFAQSGAKASLQQIKLLPTTYAPDGLIQITVPDASVTCKSTGSSTSGSSSSFTVQLSYFTQPLPLVPGTYTTVTISSGSSVTLPDLATLPLSTVGLNLGSYISSWTATTAASTSTTANQNSISQKVDGVLHITTQPTKLGDASSSLQIDVGLVSCLAQDAR